MKKIAIYSDRLLSTYFGGAEIYAINLASILSSDYSVTIFCNVSSRANERILYLKENYSQKLSREINIVGINGVGDKGHPARYELRAYKKLKKLIDGNFDAFINISNNLVPGMPNTKSYAFIHFPIPLHCNEAIMYWAKKVNKLYINSYDKLIGNSKFTAAHIEKMYRNNACYLYPPININKPGCNYDSKNNTIVTVGRIAQDKKLLEMVKTFVDAQNGGKLKDFCFIVIGICDDIKYLNSLRKASNDNVKILTNLTQNEINEILSRGKFYWHAKGYKQTDPSLMEHFGMSTVEAMSQGCVPIVFEAGGQKEIVTEGCGKTWTTLDQLVKHTVNLNNEHDKLIEYATNSINKSNDYSFENYKRNIVKLLDLA